ncbi:MAG: hypothetical protein AAGJ93_05625 [Bacteroidota bacterium]
MKKYIPINCHYYDELEAYATLRKNVAICYYENGTDIQEKMARIVDFRVAYLELQIPDTDLASCTPNSGGSGEKAEYMILDDNSWIRLDWLVSVDGKVPPGAC